MQSDWPRLFFLICLLLFSCPVMSDSLWLHGLQHAGLPCPSPTSSACSNSCPLSQWCHPNISSSVIPLLLPSIFPSIRLPKYWSFSFSISPSSEYSGLISFRFDLNHSFYWFDLLAVQGTVKSLLQHHSSKASVLWWSAFFIVQLSHPYMTNWKPLALTRWTFTTTTRSY